MSLSARSIRPVHAALWVVMAALCFVAFHLLGNTVLNVNSRSVFVWMTVRWGDRVSFGADYSIGWFIPVISIGLVWMRRKRLAAAPRAVNWWGLPLIAGGLFLHWIGARAQQPRLSLMAFAGLLWALPFLCYGWRFAKWLIFPCGYLLFCIPWNFLDAATFPMRLFSTAVSASLLNGIGIGVMRSGTIIRSIGPGGLDFNVADPCSGLSSMLAMAAITALYANLTQPTLLRQALLFAASIPLAVCGNVFRILTIAVVARLAGRELALALYHDYSAFLVFPVAILLMLAVGKLIRSFTPGNARAWIRARLQPR